MVLAHHGFSLRYISSSDKTFSDFWNVSVWESALHVQMGSGEYRPPVDADSGFVVSCHKLHVKTGNMITCC